MPNIVYIGTSLDGYIADRDGGLGFLECVPNPEGDDFGFQAFMGGIDALLLGRVTYETVLSFRIDWPYSKPVFVLSSTLNEVPAELEGKVELVSGELDEVIGMLNGRGYKRLYVDGGKVIQGCLQKGLIDELIITRVPMLVGGGTRLFPEMAESLLFEHVKTEVLLGQLVQSYYRRKSD